MRSRSLPGLRIILALTMLLICCAAPGFAQQDDKVLPPPYDVPTMEHNKPWLQWLAGTLLAGLTLAIAFKNPHRSHLD
ncbi:MAG: hypothetical protein ABIG44_13895 [Planctomycetota bacterium]